MRKLFKWKFLSCVLLCLAVGLLPMVQAEAVVVSEPLLDEDTKGDWLTGSALNGRVYGDCFYLLPDPSCKGFPEPLYGSLKGGVCTSGLSYFVSDFDLRRGRGEVDDAPRTFWNTYIDCAVPADVCGTDYNCYEDFSSCAGSAQWNPCANAFKSTLWDEGDCVTPGGIKPPLIAELTLDFQGSTELAYYFVATCGTERTQPWTLYIDGVSQKSGVIEVTGDGKYLYFQLDNVVPGTEIRFETVNELLIDDPTLCENSVLSGVFLSNCCTPDCALDIDKKCLVAPPAPGPFDCDGKVDALKMVWNGTDTLQSVTAYRGDVGAETLPAIISEEVINNQIRQVVTVSGYQPSTNDVIWDWVSVTDFGQSKFHLSCSDNEMNGPEHCGKAQGNGKNNEDDKYDNVWLLDGLETDKGFVLDCTPLPAEPLNDCVFEAMPPPNCETFGKPTSLTFRYTGDGCSASSNSQGG